MDKLFNSSQVSNKILRFLQGSLKSMIVNLSSASNNTLKIPKVISVD